jgi:hypothetical protein
MLLARNTGVLLTTRTGWKSVVAALKRSDCAIRDDCLQQLAVSAGTLYALYAQLERSASGSEVTASGRVVNQNGLQSRPIVRITVAKKTTFEDAAREALKQLIAKLQLETLSPVLELKPVAAATPASELKAPAAGPKERTGVVDVPPAERPGAGLRLTGFVAAGLAVAAGGVSLGFGLSALSARGTLPADGRLLDAEQVRTQQQVDSRATASLAAGITAGVLAAAGIAMIVVGAPTGSGSRSTVSVAPVAGGAVAFVGGEL